MSDSKEEQIKSFQTIIDRLNKENEEKDNPDSLLNKKIRYIKLWEILLNSVSIWMFLFIPFYIAFRPKYYILLKIFNSIFDVMYICEIPIQIYKRKLKDFRMESKILNERVYFHQKNYFRFYFFLDILAAIPFNLIELGIDSTNAIRWLRMLRLVRLVHTYEFLKSIETNFFYENPYFYMAYILFYFLLWFHIFTCIIYYFATKLGFDKSWSYNQTMERRTIFQRYITSLYFITTSFSLVGYGDIVPITPSERIYICFVLIFSTFYVAYATGKKKFIFSFH